MTHRFAGDAARTPLLQPEWEYLAPPTLDDYGVPDWARLREQRRGFDADQQVNHVLRLLQASAGDPSFGYQVNNYRHSLQAATAALLDGRDEEYVVVALLHDVGFTACPTSHGAFAASLIGPYVSDASRWLLEYHQIFLAHHCQADPEQAEIAPERERWRGHAHFAATAEFVAQYDLTTIMPGMPEAPIDTFAPMLARLLSRPPRRLAPHAD